MSETTVLPSNFDREILDARLAALCDPEVKVIVRWMVDASIACTVMIGRVDFKDLETHASQWNGEKIWTEVDMIMQQIWAEISNLHHQLNTFGEAGNKEEESEESEKEEEEEEEGGGDDFDFDFGAEPVIKAPSTPISRLQENAWAMAFVLSSEENSFKQRLPFLRKVEDGWEVIGSIEDHLGHIRSALSALLVGVMDAVPQLPHEQSASSESLELMASLELRRRIFSLRDSFLKVEQKMEEVGPGEWQDPLTQASELVSEFVFGPGFAWLRANDKRVFLEQKRELSEVLSLWSPLRAMPARHAIQNFARFLEALEILNQRESLVNHDRAALEIVVDKTGEAMALAGPERGAAMAAGLAALAEVEGRDKQLDKLLESAMDPGSVVPLEDILNLATAALARLSE